MSDDGPRAMTEFDYYHSVIEFTKICSEKCGVLKGKDDKLDNSEINCLSNFFLSENNSFIRTMRKQCKRSQKHITEYIQTSLIDCYCITKFIDEIQN